MSLRLPDAQRRLEQFIQTQGLKHTRQREEILEVFLGVEGHCSVEELTRAVQQKSPGVGNATIYRTMRLLVDAKIAHERQFGDGQTRYEPLSPDEHHDHLICLDCNEIFEFEDNIKTCTLQVGYIIHLQPLLCSSTNCG